MARSTWRDCQDDGKPHACSGVSLGWSGFRDGQLPVVPAALAGRWVLLVSPTGSGKSLCFQLPSSSAARHRLRNYTVESVDERPDLGAATQEAAGNLHQ